MTNKPSKSWGEIQLAIVAVAFTATLGFWNLFSAGQKQQVTITATNSEVPPTEEVTQAPAPTPRQGFLPVKIIFGGKAPQQRVVVQANAAPAQPKRKSNGGGGGGGGVSAPQPSVSTGSSKP